MFGYNNGWVVGAGSDHVSSIGAMLTAAQGYIYGGQKPMHKLVFAAVAQEESDLGGMKKLYADWQGRASAFVDILGAGHVIAYGAITIHQWTVVASGPDGPTLGGWLPHVNQGIAPPG